MLIKMQKEQIKFQDSCVFEGMTSIRAIIRAIDTQISDRVITKILYDKDKYSKIAKELGYLKAVSSKYGYTVEESCADELEDITLGTSHGGIVAICGQRTLPCLSEISELPERGFYAMIEGIEDPYNFGYAGIILSERNWMSAAGVVARSSAGASELFKIYKSAPLDAATFFKDRGYTVVCADERTDNILGKCEMKLPLLLLVGGEKRGISKSLLECADLLVRIDYGREFNASLSAASATTMFCYEIMRQNSNFD